MNWKKILKYEEYDGPDIGEVMEREEQSKRLGGGLHNDMRKDFDEKIEEIESFAESISNQPSSGHESYKKRRSLEKTFESHLVMLYSRLDYAQAVGVDMNALNEYYNRMDKASRKIE